MIYACHTWYSLLYGTMRVEEAVEEAAARGMEALLIADINNTSACIDFARECLQRNIHAVCGVECRNGNAWLYTLVARNLEGFREINAYLTRHNFSKEPYPARPPAFVHVYAVYPFANIPAGELDDNEYLAVCPHEVNRVAFRPQNVPADRWLAYIPVAYTSPDGWEFHRHLRAIGENTLLTMLTPEQLAPANAHFIAPDFLTILYGDVPACLHNARRLLADCSFGFDFRAPKNKQVFSGSRYDDHLLLEKLAFEGMAYRYGKQNAEAERRIRNELEVIARLGFSAYFLITWDIIRYSLSRGIYHVGRGSGGNSIVAYCLRITDIDPIELNLYFERFINPQRTSPPDFDIDYSWRDRDTIHEYIFRRHGRDYTALLGAINTFRDSSVVRELGKVYGMPKADIDRLVEAPDNPMLHNDITEKIFAYGNRLMDFPHHRSIHAGGVLVSELPLYYYTALDLPPKNMPVTQWDMYVAEEIGFEKLDILSQRGLGHIRECADLVRTNRGIEIDVHQVEQFKRDPEVNRRLYNGEAIGCFYIESPAMRGLLKKLKCSDYISLVAASSIIRPGVAKSGMMREYIRRFHHPNGYTYLHPVFEEQLGETYGVMVYQEDVLKICHHFAGLTLADADILRRAMSGKFRSRQEFDRIRNDFFANCRQRGHAEALAEEVWRQVSSFAGYAFCKAHSASYAVESYQSLYLKTYFPHEFHVAVINNFGGFYRTWVYANEAQRYGATIHLPDVNHSRYLTTLSGTDIYLGFVHVKNLEADLAHGIVDERTARGVYAGMDDFLARMPVGREQLTVLVRAGALRFTGLSKKELMWQHLLADKSRPQATTGSLFPVRAKTFTLPALRTSTLEDAYDEMELLGFPVSLSRFDMLQTAYRGNTMAADLPASVGRVVRMTGDLVTIKYVHTVKKEWMHFGCFLDPSGAFFDTVHFPASLKKYPFTGHGVYLMEGKVVEEFGFPSVEVHKMARLPFQPDPRAG